jgi:hypothetical protein
MYFVTADDGDDESQGGQIEKKISPNNLSEKDHIFLHLYQK